MSDSSAPSAPDAEVSAAASSAGIAADLLNNADPAVVAALREQLGLGPAPSTEATVPPRAAAPSAADAENFMRPAGVHEVQTAERPTITGEVRLNVPGPAGTEVYICGNKPPAQALIDAIEIHKQAQVGGVDNTSVILTMRRFLEAVLLPGHKERYLERLSGYSRNAAGDTLEPIDLPEMMTHASRLLEVYIGRPLGTAPSSGPGGPTSAPTSTAGA